MPSATIVGLDTAKNAFQVHGVDSSGNVVLRKRLRRGQLTDFFANLPHLDWIGSDARSALLGTRSGDVRSQCPPDRSAVRKALFEIAEERF